MCIVGMAGQRGKGWAEVQKTGFQSEIWSLHNMNPMKKISLSFDLFKVKSSNLFFFNCLEGKKVTYIFTYKELLSSKSRTIFTILNSGSKVH